MDAGGGAGVRRAVERGARPPHRVGANARGDFHVRAGAAIFFPGGRNVFGGLLRRQSVRAAGGVLEKRFCGAAGVRAAADACVGCSRVVRSHGELPEIDAPRGRDLCLPFCVHMALQRASGRNRELQHGTAFCVGGHSSKISRSGVAGRLWFDAGIRARGILFGAGPVRATLGQYPPGPFARTRAGAKLSLHDARRSGTQRLQLGRFECGHAVNGANHDCRAPRKERFRESGQRKSCRKTLAGDGAAGRRGRCFDDSSQLASLGASAGTALHTISLAVDGHRCRALCLFRSRSDRQGACALDLGERGDSRRCGDGHLPGSQSLVGFRRYSRARGCHCQRPGF